MVGDIENNMVNNNEEGSLKAHKENILQNINHGKQLGINRISAIIALEDEGEILQEQLIAWLKDEGYQVSLLRGECNTIIIEW